MNEEKRTVDSYTVEHAIHVGDKEIVFATDENKTDTPYIVCDCEWFAPLGVYRYFSAEGSIDYLEMMGVFITRVSVQIEAMKEEKVRAGIPLEPVTPDQCEPNDYTKSIENMVVVIRADRLRPEYRTANNQIVLAKSGFGIYGNSRGRAVYTVNLFSGKQDRWNREDVLGILKPEHMPEWAKKRLKEIQARKQEKHKAPER